jgi:hypothetical protein
MNLCCCCIYIAKHGEFNLPRTSTNTRVPNCLEEIPKLFHAIELETLYYCMVRILLQLLSSLKEDEREWLNNGPFLVVGRKF